MTSKGIVGMAEVPKVVGEIDSRGKPRVQTVNELPSRTVQSDSYNADIRNIMGQFGGVNLGDTLDDASALYADVSEFTDLRDALDQARMAEVDFMKLPPGVRQIFNHDVAEWLDTAHDKDKRDALVAAGFIEAPVESVPSGGGSPPAAEGTAPTPSGSSGSGEAPTE